MRGLLRPCQADNSIGDVLDGGASSAEELFQQVLINVENLIAVQAFEIKYFCSSD